MSNAEEADNVLNEVEQSLNLLTDAIRNFGLPGGKPYNQMNSDIEGIASDLEYAQHCVSEIDDDDEEKEDFVTRFNDVKTQFEDCKRQFQLKRQQPQDELSAGLDEPSQAKPTPKTDEEALEEAKTMKDDIESSLQRTLQMSEAAVQVHQGANEALQNQTEQLQRIEDDLVDMDDDIKRAKQVVGQIFRRVWSDKCLVILLAVLVLAIAGVLIASGLVK